MTATQATPLVLGLEHNGICMSTDEFDAFTEYDERYKYQFEELVIAERQACHYALLPGFELNLPRLFTVADFWESDQ
jgi:hypothetical protein